MALNISAWSIRRPLPSVVLSIILLLLGWVSFMRLPITRLPAADIPVISVVVSQFGAGPSELEAQVTKYIEDSVSGVEGVRHIASQITDGLSVTTIQFRAGDEHRSRAQRHQGRGHAGAAQPAAEHRRRAAGPAGRPRRPAHRHLCRDLAGQDAGAAVVVRGRCRASARCRACAASPRWSGSAASTAKSWCRSIPTGCRRSA